MIVHRFYSPDDPGDACGDARAAVVLAALAQDDVAVGEICGALRLVAAFMSHVIERYPDAGAMNDMAENDCEIVMAATGYTPDCFNRLARMAANMAMRTAD